jgi:hypothetical protein
MKENLKHQSTNKNKQLYINPYFREELQDLFAAIQSKKTYKCNMFNFLIFLDRMKKKSINEKRAMENELKKTISRTVDEMNQKIELAKSQM